MFRSAGGKVDRSLTYSNIAKALNGEQIISADNVATGENISRSNTISHETSGGDSSATSTAAASSQDSYSDFSSEEPGSTDTGNIVSNIAGAAVEAILQPNVAPSMGGGGGSSHSDDDDERKEKITNPLLEDNYGTEKNVPLKDEELRSCFEL